MIMPTGRSTKRIAYRRATTFVGCLEDTYNLMAWKNRQVAYGMGQRKDLVLAAAAADPSDKKRLNEIADKATEHAMASASATTGTALHSLTERIDRGKELGYVPTEYEADIKAYEAATKGIEWLGIESFRVHDDWKVAGTTDRIGIMDGRLRIFDIKTGSIDFPHKMAMQLAMYAHSIPYDIPTDKRGERETGLDLTTGIIIHLPAGEGRCDLYEIDIHKGWGACIIAKQVWDWRSTKNLTSLITDDTPPAKPTFVDLARDAETLEDLRDVWRRAKKAIAHSTDFLAACEERKEQLLSATTTK